MGKVTTSRGSQCVAGAEEAFSLKLTMVLIASSAGGSEDVWAESAIRSEEGNGRTLHCRELGAWIALDELQKELLVRWLQQGINVRDTEKGLLVRAAGVSHCRQRKKAMEVQEATAGDQEVDGTLRTLIAGRNRRMTSGSKGSTGAQCTLTRAVAANKDSWVGSWK